MPRKLSDSEREKSARTVAIFSFLIHALQTDNQLEAEQRQQELLELGLKVELTPAINSTRGGLNE